MPAIYLLPLEISPCSRGTMPTRPGPAQVRRTLQCAPTPPVVIHATFYAPMAQLPILEYPDPRLRVVTNPVDAGRTGDPAFQRMLAHSPAPMSAAAATGLPAR